MSAPSRLNLLLDRLTRLHSAARRCPGLNAAQASALDYLAQANAFSRSPSAVADYLDATRGTVSQTLRVLARKGFVVAVGNPVDGRSLRYDLTAAGQGALTADPVLGADDAGLEEALDSVLRRMIAARGGRSFGICRSCRFHERGTDGHARCRLLDVALAPPETRRICREHVPA